MTQVRNTSPPSSQRPSMIVRWLAVIAVATSLGIPAAAHGSSPGRRAGSWARRTMFQRSDWPSAPPPSSRNGSTRRPPQAPARDSRGRTRDRGRRGPRDRRVGGPRRTGPPPHPRGAPTGRLIRIAGSPESVLVVSPAGTLPARRVNARVENGAVDDAVSSPVFVGRDEERAALGAALVRAAGGRAQAASLAELGRRQDPTADRVQARLGREPGALAHRRLSRFSRGRSAVRPIIAALRTVASDSIDPDQIAEIQPRSSLGSTGAWSVSGRESRPA